MAKKRFQKNRVRKRKRIKTWRDWLVFREREVDRNTIRKYYEQWRNEQGLPSRCDNEACTFHRNPLIWNGGPLKPNLDHVSGNRFDNRPINLRFYCPNCDSQLPTRGGGNRGRVIDVGKRQFTLVSRKGVRDYNKIPGAAGLGLKGLKPGVRVAPIQRP